VSLRLPGGTKGLSQPFWFVYGYAMASTTLKDIPRELHAQLKCEAAANFRSLSQEALARIQRSLDLEQRLSAPMINRLVKEALESGPEETLTRENLMQHDAELALAEHFRDLHCV
jgi:hypothetical protein